MFLKKKRKTSNLIKNFETKKQQKENKNDTK